MDDKEIKIPIAERENLMEDKIPHYIGFTPRPIQCLATQKPPSTMVSIECRHFLRTKNEKTPHHNFKREYQLWLKAGKSPPIMPDRPDTNYNSSEWRNFARQVGLNFSASASSISEAVAALYPMNIPPSSQLGKNSFEKFLREAKLFRDERAKALAILRAKKEQNYMNYLRWKSDARNPPQNEKGDIIPPENFKKYEPGFRPLPSPPPSPPPFHKTDLFGQPYTPRSSPRTWKLSYKLNHPEYQKLRGEVKKQKETMEKKWLETSKVPQLKLSPVRDEV